MSSKLFDLSDRVALVTGGSRGLGKAMARGLAEAGADVIITSRHEHDLRQALQDILHDTGRRGAYVVADMEQRQQVERLAEAAMERLGRVDILVNNAGTNLPRPIDQLSDADWDRILQLNLTSCMALTRALVPQMKQHRWGRIIFIASVMALASKEGRHVYSATKAALLGMMRSCALELGAYGITVNAIAPGPFLTDLPASILSKQEQEAVAQRTALGRWGQPGELAGPALLLASEAGSYITGSTLVVDGGIMCRVF